MNANEMCLHDFVQTEQALNWSLAMQDRIFKRAISAGKLSREDDEKLLRMEALEEDCNAKLETLTVEFFMYDEPRQFFWDFMRRVSR